VTNRTGSWVATGISSGGIDVWSSIAVDATNAPSIAYSRNDGGVRLASLGAGGWTTRVVDADRVATMPELTIDESGTRHVVYSMATGDYARCDVPLCPDYPGLRHATSGPTGPFTAQAVTSDGDDVYASLNRGWDGGLSAAFLRNGSGVFEVQLAGGATRILTALTDLSPASVAKGATITLSAKLMAGARVSPRQRLVFKVDGAVVGYATTNANGVATLPWKATVVAGAHSLTVGYEGSTRYLAARLGPRTLTVKP
jgi:hypothetical protein